MRRRPASLAALALAGLALTLAPARAAAQSPPVSLAPAVLAAAPSPSVAPGALAAAEAAVSAGATLVVVPLSLVAAGGLGSLSSNLIGAALPALLVMLVVPPVVVAGAATLVGNALAPGEARFVPAVLVGAGVQLLAIVGGALAGVWSGNVGSVALFTLAEMVALPTAVTVTLHATRPRARSTAPPLALRASLRMDDVGLPRVIALPIFTAAF